MGRGGAVKAVLFTAPLVDAAVGQSIEVADAYGDGEEVPDHDDDEGDVEDPADEGHGRGDPARDEVTHDVEDAHDGLAQVELVGPEPPEEEEKQVGHQGGLGLHNIDRLTLGKGAGAAGVVDVGGLVVLGLFGHGLLPLEGGPRVRPQIFGGWIWRRLHC